MLILLSNDVTTAPARLGVSASRQASLHARDVYLRPRHDRNRPVLLSITHKLSPQDESEFDIGQTGHATPHYSASGRGVFGTRQVAAQPSDLRQIRGEHRRAVLRASTGAFRGRGALPPSARPMRRCDRFKPPLQVFQVSILKFYLRLSVWGSGSLPAILTPMLSHSMWSSRS